MNRRTCPARERTPRSFLAAATCYLAVFATAVLAGAKDAPYPPSPAVAGLTWHKRTLTTAARGSDQFPFTWAADGNLYTDWGDGWGFKRTLRGKTSVGVTRITGGPRDYTAQDLWAGVGKCCGGIIAVNRTIYMYIAEQGKWKRSRLAYSTDSGRHWKQTGWVFSEPEGLFASPGVIQFGRDYEGARDKYIYGYGMESPKSRKDLYLFRVLAEKILDRKQYEFCSGRGADGRPQWSARIAKAAPVFHDPSGVQWGVNCFYHRVSKRYWLTVRHKGDTGRWGLFDAPQPWGPWTTIAYGDDFPEWTYTPVSGRPAWVHVFPTKWISRDGQTLWQVSDRGDRFNLVEVTLRLRPAAEQSSRADRPGTGRPADDLHARSRPSPPTLTRSAAAWDGAAGADARVASGIARERDD